MDEKVCKNATVTQNMHLIAVFFWIKFWFKEKAEFYQISSKAAGIFEAFNSWEGSFYRPKEDGMRNWPTRVDIRDSWGSWG